MLVKLCLIIQRNQNLNKYDTISFGGSIYCKNDPAIKSIEKIKNLKNIQANFKTQINQPTVSVNLQTKESSLKEDKKIIQDEPKIIITNQKKFSYNNEK